jgi:hypothetical protein
MFRLNDVPYYNNVVYNNGTEFLKKRKNDLSILCYPKNTEMQEETLGWIRSVIIDEDSKAVLSFSPPKSSPIPNGLDFMSADCYMEEFVEGTMINLFWNPKTQQWQWATRNSTDANVSFYSSKTFDQMFQEALHTLSIDLNEFDKSCSYSFVLQHPENRIVTPFTETKLYLIDIFEIYNTCVSSNVIETIIKPYTHPLHTTAIALKFQSIQFPAIFNGRFKNMNEIKLFLKDQPSSFMGLVVRLQGETFMRFKIRNYKFDNLLALRGNHSNLMTRYLEVKKEKKVKKYLAYFPEHKLPFDCFHFHYQQCLTFLFTMYVSRFMKKETFVDMSNVKYLSKTLKQIHWHYKTYLKPMGLKVDNQFIYDYFGSLAPVTQEKNVMEFICYFPNSAVVVAPLPPSALALDLPLSALVLP